ncbi:protein phosphatase 2C domain-containing protein [Streptomyces sp. NPDC019990]|uniref:protein phosphatase 2C domain-containing protein n=1 Tax=Streptomyces sp. NPDC019990 TaxID=3154693 RepID=UPI0033DC450E
MSQQGGRPTGREDDWWRRLYDDSSGDAGPAPAPDSLDDRFASAAEAVGERADGGAGTPGRADEHPGVGAEPPGARSDSRPAQSLEAELRAGDGGAESGEGVPRAGGGDARSVVPGSRGGGAEAEPVEGVPRGGGGGAEAAGAVPRGGGDGALSASCPTDRIPPPAPWEPPPERPAGPVTFPAGPAPAGRAGPAPEREPTGGATSPAGPRPPSAGPREAPATTIPASRAHTAPPPVPPPPSTPPSQPSADAADPPPPTGTPPGRGEPGAEPQAPDVRSRGHVGSRPPTYDAEPTALPAADPDDLGDLVADTVLDGARYGACTLRAVSLRGDSARYRGEPRRDSLLTARFGAGEQALLLVAMATGARATPWAHRAATEACHWIGRAVGRSHVRLVEDIRAGRRGDLKSGLHRLTDRSLGRLRAGAAEQGIDPGGYAASLRCLLLSADPECRTRVFFGVGPGGLFRLRDGAWQDIEPRVVEAEGGPVLGFGSPPAETPEGDRLTMDLGIPTPPSPYELAPEPPREPFRFRTSVARPGDTLLMCSEGFADPLRGEPELGAYLAGRWSSPEPPGLAVFLADSQVRVKGYADDRTAAAVWES